MYLKIFQKLYMYIILSLVLSQFTLPVYSADYYNMAPIPKRKYSHLIKTDERRNYHRFKTMTMLKPVKIYSEFNQSLDIIDISRGGIALSHNNTLKVGDIIPVTIQYSNCEITTDIKILSATAERAGAEFVNTTQDMANRILYVSILLERDNNLLVTKLSH